jgi:hypothetical protein
MEHVITFVNAVANNVMLQLSRRHDFRNTIFKIKHILYMSPGSAPPLPLKLWLLTYRHYHPSAYKSQSDICLIRTYLISIADG